jgi:hypothetical protein
VSNKWFDRKKSTVVNTADRDPDIPANIRTWEINKGGWRYDERDKDYFLTWPQLLEYEKKNETTFEDYEFYDWFREFRTKEKIWDRGASSSSSVARSYTKSWDWEEEKPKGKWLSSWWAKDVYKGFSTNNEVANKLALVLQAVRTTIRVVDDTVPALTVSWANNEMSYTDFKKHKIAINPAPVSDHTIEDGQAVDITTGFALHEASHSQYSREPYQTILQPTPLRPLQIAGMLLNFVEDIRIEAATTDKFPGFAGYFEKSLDWAWGKSQAHLPAEWGPTLGEKMNAILAIIRFPEGPATLTHPSFADEIPWWTNWRDDYLAERVNARDTIQRGLDRLREDAKTKEEMESMEGDEKAAEKAGEELKKLLDKMTAKGLKELKIRGTDAGTEIGEEIDAGTMDTVETLLTEGLQEEKVFIRTQNGRGNPPLYVRHPSETPESRSRYIGKPKPMLGRLKAALVFRQELPRYTTRLLKSGNLDEEELWRWAANDYRVFNEEVIAGRPQTQLSLLVDMSGSMWGEKLNTAQELAQLFIWALKDMEGVETRVFGHTGDLGTIACEVYKLWEPGEPMTRLGLITAMEHSQNYDGHAIAWCAKEVLDRGQPEEQRILFVLSDGYPAASGYGGSEGQQHVREVVNWAESHGVHVIQIAIDPSVEPSRQARMFKEFIQFTSLEEVPKQLTRMLAKYT